MKLECDVVQDLLPLYADEACSDASRELVEAHTASCPTCRAILETLSRPMPLPELPEPEERVLQTGFRRMRRRWAASVLAVLMLFPLTLVILMGVHQLRGEGFCFTNLDDIYSARRFVALAAAGDYEQAAARLDFRQDYDSVQEALAVTAEDLLPCLELRDMAGCRVAVDTDEAWLGVRDTTDPAEALDCWAYMLYNRAGRVLYPEDVWMALQPEAEPQPGPLGMTEYWVTETGEGYVRLETPWGPVYTRTDFWLECRDLTTGDWAGVCRTAAVVPAELYEAALPELRRQAEQELEETRLYFAGVAGLTLEEFEAGARAAFVRTMESLENEGWSLTRVRYETSARNPGGEGGWTVTIRAQETDPAGKISPIGICLSVTDRGVYLSAGYSQDDSPCLNAFRAVYLGEDH